MSDDTEYTTNQIDVIQREIITNEGIIIKFSDMGTGQSQSAYLQGLLSITDNRKIIALFDEVAMLDSQSLAPIFDKLSDLHNQEKLLLGVVVQKSDSVDVKPLI